MKEAWRILIRLHKLAFQLGCAEFAKQMRAGEGQVQTDAQAASYYMQGLVGPDNICFPGFRGPGGFRWEFSGVATGRPPSCHRERETDRQTERQTQGSADKHCPFDLHSNMLSI